MLLISEHPRAPLPERFHLVNDICAIIYDQLTDLVANPHYVAYFNHTSFDIQQDLQDAAEKLKDGDTDVLDWLKENNRSGELTTILVKHIAQGIIADMTHFIYESLNCARKGKMAVAYSLLRRPFTDELLLLEQLLADPQDFVQRFFYDGDPQKYDPASGEFRKKEKAIIEAAIAKISTQALLSAETIYKIRYDTSHSNSIYGIANQALHIVTTRQERYKTRQQNLNFIFNAGPEDYEKHCEHYYQFIPILLVHTAAICDELLFPYLPVEKYTLSRLIRGFKRMLAIGFLDRAQEENLLDGIAQAIGLECEKCGHHSQPGRADLEIFLRLETMPCEKCLHPHPLDESAIVMLEAFATFRGANEC